MIPPLRTSKRAYNWLSLAIVDAEDKVMLQLGDKVGLHQAKYEKNEEGHFEVIEEHISLCVVSEVNKNGMVFVKDYEYSPDGVTMSSKKSFIPMSWNDIFTYLKDGRLIKLD